MNIIYTKNEFQYYTDSITRKDKFIEFETITKKGQKIKHELSYDQIAEIAEQDGTLEEYRAAKKQESIEE